jgi:hypothetical protein
MYNVKKPMYLNKTIRIPLDLAQKLSVLAQREQISLNNLIIQCCEYALGCIETDENRTVPNSIRKAHYTHHKTDNGTP